MRDRLGTPASAGIVAGPVAGVVAGALALVLAPASIVDAAPAAEPGIIYLNFSDGTLVLTEAEVDDAAADKSSIGGASPYPAFSWPSIVDGTTTREQLIRTVVRRVHEEFLPYNVLITTTRPGAGPYTMVLIGGTARDIGINDLSVAGLAFMDCGNQQSANVVFAFPSTLRGGVQGLVVTIAQEAAHAFGLEHTTNTRDIMYPRVDPAQASFPDEESGISGDLFCGGATQNSHRRLLDHVGAWPGGDKPVDDGTRFDRDPPRLALLEPAPGGVVAQPFLVRVSAEDDVGIDHLVLDTGTDRSTLRRPPFAWSLDGLPAGPVTLTVTGYDTSGNSAQATTTLTLGKSVAVSGSCAIGRGAGPAGGSACTVALAALVACMCRRRRL